MTDRRLAVIPAGRGVDAAPPAERGVDSSAGAIRAITRRPAAEASRATGAALSVDVHPRHDSCAVVLSGELDVATGPLVVMVVDHLVANGHRRVVVDLASVQFCDVRGLGALRTLTIGLRRRGGSLTLCRPSSSVAGLLRLLDLTTTLPIDQREPGERHRRPGGPERSSPGVTGR